MSYASAMGQGFSRTPHQTGAKKRILLWQRYLTRQAVHAEGLLPIADWHIFRDWAEVLAAHHLLFHAASLERNGESVLLVGKPEAGKSTLALALVRRGFRYLSDEYAVVHPGTFEALPFPKALCIKDKETVFLENPDRHFDAIPFPKGCRPRFRKAVCLIPRKEIVPSPGQSAPVRRIVFVNKQAAAKSPASVPRWRATMELYESSWRVGESTLRNVAALARKAEFWELCRNGVEGMADSIESITERKLGID